MGRGDCRNYYKGHIALASVAQWTEHQLVNQGHMDKTKGEGGGGGGRWVWLGWGGGLGRKCRQL